MIRPLSWSTCGTVFTLAGALFAAPSPVAPTKASSSAPPADPGTSHARQFDVGLEIAAPYEMRFRYDSSPRCAPFDRTKSAADQQKFCGYGSAPQVGLSIGFAPVGWFEPYVFGRFGLSDAHERTNMGKAVIVGAGARIYTMSDEAFKFFFAPFLALDVTSGPVDANDADDRAFGTVSDGSFRTDILAGVHVGPMYDVSKHVGIYAAGGLSFGFLRYLGATADVSIGVQLRAP